MGSVILLLSVFFLVATATSAIVWLYLRYRSRRQLRQSSLSVRTQPTGVEETQSTVVREVRPVAPEEPEAIVTGQAQSAAAEKAIATSEGGTQVGVTAEAQPMLVQEPEAISAGETKPTAVEETEPKAEEELQPSVVEDTRAEVREEARPTAPEEIGPTGEEEKPLQVPEEVSRKPPGKRGGRPRGTAQGGKKGPAPETKSRGPKPEIVCWKREMQWIPAVEVPEELLEGQNLVVLQDLAAALAPDKSREECWRLAKTSGEVVVQLSDAEGAEEMRIPLGKEGYLLFKLSGPDLSQGRKVNSPSSGSYLAIVPDDWERDELRSGPPPVMPEAVTLDGYRAHFFELEKGSDSRIAFRTPKGQSVVIESKESQFELVGNQVNDASDTMGPLFAGRPPRVRGLDPEVWKRVSTIVIGEEGSGRGRWRTEIAPDPDETEQDLPSELAARKGGWYFVRFYDTNDELIESLHFRFLCALKEIEMPQPSPLPTQDGHSSVCVEFLHEPGCVVQPVDGLPNIQIERQDDKTILSIPPDPAYDKTRWLVGPDGGPCVEVTILVERLWWGVGAEDNEPSEWKDRPFTLSREDFAATSRKALWFRFPRHRWVRKIWAGFEKGKARPYNVKITDKTLSIPLREFGDSEELADKMREYLLRVWLEQAEQLEGVVAIIPPSQLEIQPATPHWIGFGRKKTAVAKVVLNLGPGEMTVNGQPLDHYFRKTPTRANQFLYRLLELAPVHEALLQLDAAISVRGSRPTRSRQVKAVAHALARALMDYDPKLKQLLKQAGFGGVRVKRKHLSQLEA